MEIETVEGVGLVNHPVADSTMHVRWMAMSVKLEHVAVP